MESLGLFFATFERHLRTRTFLVLTVVIIPVGSFSQSVQVNSTIRDSLQFASPVFANHKGDGNAISRTITDIGEQTQQSVDGLIWTFSCTALFALEDHQLYTTTRAVMDRSPLLRTTGTVMINAGNGGYQAGFAGVLGLYGYVFNDRRARKTAGECAETILIDGLAVQALKRITGRESPASATHLKGRWRLFPSPRFYDRYPGRYYSFPSGHISSTVATLTVLFNNYRELEPYRPVAYALTALVGISLVEKGMHWYSDLPLGAFLGYTIGSAISRPVSEDSENSRVALRVAPSIHDHSLALHATLTF